MTDVYMNNKEQINAFADDIDRLVNRYREDEFDMSYAAVMGVLFMKAQLLCIEVSEENKEDENMSDEPKAAQEWTYNYESGYWSICSGREIIRGKELCGPLIEIAMTEKSAKAICDAHNTALERYAETAERYGAQRDEARAQLEKY